MSTEKPLSYTNNEGPGCGWRVIFQGVMGARRHSNKAAADASLVKIEKGLSRHEPVPQKWFSHKDPRLS